MTLMYGLHGFRVRDAGLASIDTLKPFALASGYAWRDLDYGWVGLLRLRLRNQRVAKRIAVGVQPGSVLVCHSNGAAIAYEAAWKHGLRGLKALVLINPALDAELWFPRVTANRIIVLHNRYDRPVRAAVWWAKLVNLFSPLSWPLGGHTWGEAGASGFTHAVGFNGPPLVQIDTGAPGPGQVKGHSAIFSRLDYWWPGLDRTLDAGGVHGR